ncbi:MAG: bifunctional 5,10-methylenetetrahydrofolate dehydrogenase/5,10-methenyltetrahydrofolate cyclohydrolase [Candidatus Omnitrophota bacterium]
MAEAKLLQGKLLAAEIQQKIRAKLEVFRAKQLETPSLMAVQAGEGSASDWYIGQQEKLAAQLGIRFEKAGPDKVRTQDELLRTIGAAARGGFHGIFLAMPFPAGFNADEILFHLDPRKDVEGVHPASLGQIVLRKAKLIPPTAYAAYALIQSTGLQLRGKRAAIVGQSPIVGRPLNMLLGDERVTTTVCHTGTSETDLAKILSESDIVVACAGKPGIVKGAWIKPGAVVIDVGTTEMDGKLTGDVEFEAAKVRAAFITPVPGGVGPLTVTMLMQNLIHAYQWQKGIPD